MPKRNRKDLDFQLDLTPFISLLSVCICFLLLTVAWFQIGSLTVRQALGGQAASGSGDRQSLWLYIGGGAARAAGGQSASPQSRRQDAGRGERRKITVKVKKGAKQLFGEIIAFRRGDQDEFKTRVQSLRKRYPDLNQAFVLPEKNIPYGEIIKIIDIARQAGIFNIGISPI